MAKNNIKFWEKFYKIRYYPFITKKQTDAEIKFLKEFLPQSKYENILDFICGFGRHSLMMARAGYHVEGFDIDKNSVKEAIKTVKDNTRLKNINLYVYDALKFRKKNQFDAVICLYSSIGFLNEKSNGQIFKNLFQSVKKGGRIILDVMNPEWAIKHLKSYSEKEVIYRGRHYLIRHKRKILYNPVREKNTISFLDKKSLVKYKISYKLRLYSFKELKIKFQKNNFRIYKVFGSFLKHRIFSNQ